MITTTFPDRVDQTKPFPKIMRPKDCGSLVLFTNPDTGTILHPGQTAHSVGVHLDSFTSSWYEDYNGPVTLQNK